MSGAGFGEEKRIKGRVFMDYVDLNPFVDGI